MDTSLNHTNQKFIAEVIKMKIEIESNILRYYLRNVYFINATAYAGKSTMVNLLAEKYGMVQCGENYHAKNCDKFVTPKYQPNIGYFQIKKDWQEFINRTPEEYARWIDGTSREAAQIEIAELLRIPEGNCRYQHSIRCTARDI